VKIIINNCENNRENKHKIILKISVKNKHKIILPSGAVRQKIRVRLPLTRVCLPGLKIKKRWKKIQKYKNVGFRGFFVVGFCGDVKSVKSVTSVNLNFFLHSVRLFNLHFSFSFIFNFIFLYFYTFIFLFKFIKAENNLLRVSWFNFLKANKQISK